jgi:pilus assembly protein CpaF
MTDYPFDDHKELLKVTRSLIARELLELDDRELSADRKKTIAQKVVNKILEERATNAIFAGKAPDVSVQNQKVASAVISQMFGLAGFEPYLQDQAIENIDVNGFDEVWLTYADGKKVRGRPVADSDSQLIELIRHAASRLSMAERRFDIANPQVDLRLPDGSRLSAVMGVCARPCVSIRRHRFFDATLSDEIELGLINEHMASFLSACVKSGKNILIAGRTNSGKTTLLRALINEIPPDERIITIEQSLELGIDGLRERHPDCIALEARPSNLEGVGEIDMADLVRRSLRMNPDRVIVGETLGPEIVTLLNAMSQGYGSLATLHSDSALGVFSRIASYAIQAKEHLPLEATNLLIANAVDFVVYVSMKRIKQDDPQDFNADLVDTMESSIFVQRYVSSIREVIGADGPMVVSNELFNFTPTGTYSCPAPVSTRRSEELRVFGYDTTDFINEVQC